MRNLFDSTEIATVFLDRHLIIRSFTPAIATLYNLIPSDQGRPLTDIVSRLNYDGLREDVAYVLSTLEPLERRITRIDRSVHYIMRILPYREPDSTVSGVLVTFVDVTSIVQAEAALVEADVRKDVFLATLRMNCAIPWRRSALPRSCCSRRNSDAGELLRAQAIIARQVGHMSSLLDDLLDVSRITRGSFLLKKEYVDVQDADGGCRRGRAAGNRRQTAHAASGVSATPIMLEVDPVRITQVLSNLLTNAAKYTPAGGLIDVGTRLERNGVVMFVRDNGVGLAPETMPKIFDMFTQVDRTGPLGRRPGHRLGARQRIGGVARRAHRGQQRGPRTGQRVHHLAAALADRRNGRATDERRR